MHSLWKGKMYPRKGGSDEWINYLIENELGLKNTDSRQLKVQIHFNVADLLDESFLKDFLKN